MQPQAVLDFTVNGMALNLFEGVKDAGDFSLGGQFVLNRVKPDRLAVGANQVYVGIDPLDQAATQVNVALTPVYNPGDASLSVVQIAYGTRDNPGALLALYNGGEQPVVVSLAPVPGPGTMTPATGGRRGTRRWRVCSTRVRSSVSMCPTCPRLWDRQWRGVVPGPQGELARDVREHQGARVRVQRWGERVVRRGTE